MERRRRILADESGLSIVELLVAMSIGLIVLLGTYKVVQASQRSSNRTTARVYADQTARPMLSRIIDELHSSCIGPGVVPVQSGSGDSSITFLHALGDDVTPTAGTRTVSLSSGTLSDTGTTTPPYPRSIKDVGAYLVSGTTTAPLFRYYAYDSSGTISSSPLSTPLTSATAASVVKVTVSFSVIPPKTTINADAGATVSLSDSALLRFSPASTTSAGNKPCV